MITARKCSVPLFEFKRKFASNLTKAFCILLNNNTITNQHGGTEVCDLQALSLNCL